MKKHADVTIKLTADEARSLEVELDQLVRKLRERTAAAPSTSADILIERYAAISHKVRVARNPAPRQTVRAPRWRAPL